MRRTVSWQPAVLNRFCLSEMLSVKTLSSCRWTAEITGVSALISPSEMCCYQIWGSQMIINTAELRAARTDPDRTTPAAWSWDAASAFCWWASTLFTPELQTHRDWLLPAALITNNNSVSGCCWISANKNLNKTELNGTNQPLIGFKHTPLLAHGAARTSDISS